MGRALHSKNLIIIVLTIVLLLSCSFLIADKADAATTGVVFGTGSDG